jgi:hypothetical protein
MERLFSPCTTLQDRFESQGRLVEFKEYNHEPLQELKLDVFTEEFLSAERGFTYADLYAMLDNEDTVAWLTPTASVVRADGKALFCSYYLQGGYKFSFNVDGKEIHALARSAGAISEIVDVVRRLLVAGSETYELELTNVGPSGEVFFNASSFAYLAEQCRSLKRLTLIGLQFSQENHCRMIGALSRPGLEIELKDCRITGVAAEVLAEVLGCNQGPTKLDCCYIHCSVLANGLRGNSSLKSLRPLFSRSYANRGNQELLATLSYLKENQGLVDLDLRHAFRVSDETWSAVCDYMKTHPTLEVVDLRSIEMEEVPLAPAVIESRIQALVDMLKVNRSIHTIRLNDCYNRHEIFRRSLVPHLDMNRLRPRVRAIQKTSPTGYRAKVLERALLAVRTDPNRFWMLLSENADVAFA